MLKIRKANREDLVTVADIVEEKTEAVPYFINASLILDALRIIESCEPKKKIVAVLRLDSRVLVCSRAISEENALAALTEGGLSEAYRCI